jgi:hypothetical protein
LSIKTNIYTSTLLALTLLSHPRDARAEGAVHISAQSAAQRLPLRASDGEPLSRSPLTQWLGLRATWDPGADTSRRLEASLRLRVDTDLAFDPPLADRVGSERLAFSSADLQEAFVRARRLRGLLDLTLGRHLVLDPVTAQLLDGAQLNLHLPEGASLTTYAGALVTPHSALAQDTTFGALWHDRGAPAARDTALAWALAFSLHRERLHLTLAARRTTSAGFHEPLSPPPDLPPQTLAQQIVLDDLLGAALWAQPWEPLLLEGELRYSAARDRLDRAVAAAELRWPWWALHTGARFESWSPAFDLNSLFWAFGPLPTREALLTARAQSPALGPGHLLLSAAAGLTAYSDHLPWSAPSTERNRSARLGLGWRQALLDGRWLPQLRLDLGLRAEDGVGGLLLLGSAEASATVLRGRLDLTLRGQLFRAEPDLQPYQAGTSAAGGALATLDMRAWGRLDAGAELRSTAAFAWAARLFALYSLEHELLR